MIDRIGRIALAAALATAVCAGAADAQRRGRARQTPEPVPAPLYHWIQAGARGEWLARMIYAQGTACPAPSSRRAAPDSAFAVVVCEYALPAGAAEASVGGIRFARPDSAARVVVIGDTGCRESSQGCDDESAWPFARVAAAAARAGGDLNIHVGDYIYRERCQTGLPGPCGDNWPTWEADWFQPVGALLTAAPWVFARGNHEDCTRGGRGWFLFFDPRPMPDSGCVELTEPYAVRVGGIGALLIFDSACAPWYSSCFRPAGATANDSAQAVTAYTEQFRRMAGLVSGGERAWFVTHTPVWAVDVPGTAPNFNADSTGAYILQAALRQASPAGMPPQVGLSLVGHIHLWESVDFAAGRAPVVVAGNGGSSETDGVVSPPRGHLLDGVAVEGFWMSEAFGYTLLEAVGPAWRATLQPVGFTCAASGGDVTCRPDGGGR